MSAFVRGGAVAAALAVGGFGAVALASPASAATGTGGLGIAQGSSKPVECAVSALGSTAKVANTKKCVERDVVPSGVTLPDEVDSTVDDVAGTVDGADQAAESGVDGVVGGVVGGVTGGSGDGGSGDGGDQGGSGDPGTPPPPSDPGTPPGDGSGDQPPLGSCLSGVLTGAPQECLPGGDTPPDQTPPQHNPPTGTPPSQQVPSSNTPSGVTQPAVDYNRGIASVPTAAVTVPGLLQATSRDAGAPGVPTTVDAGLAGARPATPVSVPALWPVLALGSGATAAAAGVVLLRRRDLAKVRTNAG